MTTLKSDPDLLARIEEAAAARFVRIHDCNGSGSAPPSPSDRLCSICGTADAREANSVVTLPATTIARMVRIVRAARMHYRALNVTLGMVERNQFFPFKDVTEAEDRVTVTHAEVHAALSAFDDLEAERAKEADRD